MIRYLNSKVAEGYYKKLVQCFGTSMSSLEGLEELNGFAINP
jgi:hypothetical protein